jgi:hypothetical protein
MLIRKGNEILLRKKSRICPFTCWYRGIFKLDIMKCVPYRLRNRQNVAASYKHHISAREPIFHINLFSVSQTQAVRINAPNLMRQLRRTVKYLPTYFRDEFRFVPRNRHNLMSQCWLDLASWLLSLYQSLLARIVKCMPWQTALNIWRGWATKKLFKLKTQKNASLQMKRVIIYFLSFLQSTIR